MFLGTSIKFFMTIGEYKALINAKIDSIEKDIEELKAENKTLEKEVAQLKNDTQTSVARMESLLIEVKTKLEFYIQLKGFDENGRFKK